MVQLILRALNDAKTAYGSVELKLGSFFDEYSIQKLELDSSPDDFREEFTPFLGKIQSKVSSESSCSLKLICLDFDYQSLASVMKNIRKMKHVSLRSEIVDNVDHQIVLEMTCEYGTYMNQYHEQIYLTCFGFRHNSVT